MGCAHLRSSLFTEKRIFAPLGMVDTGFYGESYPEERMAVGYGMRAGKLLNEEMGRRLLSTWRGPLAGGSIFGYEIVYTTNPDNMMILISNRNPDGGQSAAVALGEEIAGLTLGRTRPRFSLGVGLEFDSDRGLTISQVVSGSAAERDGLQSGDRLISANGTPFGDDALAVLDPYLASGEKIEFAVERDGKSMKIGVKPNPR